MSQTDMLSINAVADKLGLSVHQLRRWELMFGLEIKRGRGQQRQYRAEDLTVLERIKELVEQGWPTSQIRPQLEAEGLITPKLIGLPATPQNTDVLMEAIIGFRTFSERRFIDLSKQIDELRQLVISLTLRQELQSEQNTSTPSPWQAVRENYPEAVSTPSTPAPVVPPRPVEEISIGPQVSMAMPNQSESQSADLSIGEVTDQNFLTLLGRALDMVGWSDEQADQFCMQTFSIAHWDMLGRSQAETLIAHLRTLGQAA